MANTKQDYKETIPTEFWNLKLAKKPRPSFRTVGELKAILKQIPDELIFDHDFCERSEVVVYNVSRDDGEITVGITESDND